MTIESMLSESVLPLEEPEAEEQEEDGQSGQTEQHASQELLRGGEEEHGDGDEEVDHEDQDQRIDSLVHAVGFEGEYPQKSAKREKRRQQVLNDLPDLFFNGLLITPRGGAEPAALSLGIVRFAKIISFAPVARPAA
jgi:hypothetical protein